MAAQPDVELDPGRRVEVGELLARRSTVLGEGVAVAVVAPDVGGAARHQAERSAVEVTLLARDRAEGVPLEPANGHQAFVPRLIRFREAVEAQLVHVGGVIDRGQRRRPLELRLAMPAVRLQADRPPGRGERALAGERSLDESAPLR